MPVWTSGSKRSRSWVRTIPITDDDIKAIGKDPKTALKFPPKYGFGDNAYVVHLDISHQLHCLNTLRFIAWGQFDEAAKQPYSDLHWHHVAHCTEVLRENMMCSADLDVVTSNWKETQDVPFADFNLNKKCTDAEMLIQPQDMREVPMEDEITGSMGFTRWTWNMDMRMTTLLEVPPEHIIKISAE
ncbi:hypothetical protein E0Z10_g1493 [Xylaria hypoxylon]|uniref:Uncharacterized protein n=1 Tax=Xylaria hypoxylon TaxID=37992 RepID=A0A4Z0Z6W5_9PEZI|nr:hypothetical protein E0Z10_g1493 [Xylaria hypoxylon]